MDDSQPDNGKILGSAGESGSFSSTLQAEFDAGFQLFDKSFDLIQAKLPKWRREPQLNRLAGLARLLNVPTDESLHHYTTAAGLQGIVEQACFHASSGYFMNDSSEVDYGCQMFAEVLQKWHEEHKDDESIGAAVLNRLLDRFSDLTQMRHILARIYVVCFCEEPNLLSQWRTYGQNGGYSIGFDRSALEEFRTDATRMTITLEKVIYNVSQQKKLLESFLADGMPELNNPEVQMEFKKLTAHGLEMFFTMFTSVMEIFALREIVRFKHPAFNDEREWRLIAVPKHRSSSSGYDDSAFIKFKPSHGVPTPFLELKPKETLLPITSVRFGPTLDKKRVEHALQLLFKKYGYPEISIYGSDIPVRL